MKNLRNNNNRIRENNTSGIASLKNLCKSVWVNFYYSFPKQSKSRFLNSSLDAPPALGAATILLVFLATSPTFGSESDPLPVDLVVTVIQQVQLSQGLKAALQDCVREDIADLYREATNSWVCEVENLIGVATAIKNSSRDTTTGLSVSQAHCFSALVLFSINKKRFEGYGLTNNELLKLAIFNEDGLLRYRGLIKSVLYESHAVEGWSITVAHCPLKAVASELLDPHEVATLRESYSKAGYYKIGQALKIRDWPNAEKTWQHLKSEELLSPQVVINYGKCLLEQGKSAEAIKHFDQYLYGYSKLRDKEFFLEVADALYQLAKHNKDAEKVALKAVDEAERLLLRQQKTITLPSVPIP